MAVNDETGSFADKLARARAKAGAKIPPKPPALSKTPEPPVKVDFGKSASDKLIDNAVDSVDILEAYSAWCGKMTPTVGKRTESIMISCPDPAHLDRNPSAWINTNKQTWYCAVCNRGGDKFDIAAWHFGFSVPSYKDGVEFVKLRQKIAESRGVSIVRSITGGLLAVEPSELESEIEPLSPAPEGSAPISSPIDKPVAPVVELHDVEDIGADNNIEIELDWKSVVPEDTFLDTWMRLTVIDDVPEEYHFWSGLMAISMAIGRDVTLFDHTPVYGNFFLCILGRTGAGKSRSKNYLDQLLENALPYDPEDPSNTGAKRIDAPASAEALIHSFTRESKKVIGLPTVRGIIDYNELSSLVIRSQRQGNAIIPTLQQLYDGSPTLGTVSVTRGIVKADLPYGTVLTTSQPRSLHNLFSQNDADSGFLNRWIFAVGKYKERVAIGGAKVNISPAIAPLKRIREWADSAGELQWSQDAKKAFEALFLRIMLDQKEDSNNNVQILTRIDLTMKKLILLFSANEMEKEVTANTVRRVAGMYDYLLDCYKVPSGLVGTSETRQLWDRISRFIIRHQTKHGYGVSQAALRRAFVDKRRIEPGLFVKVIKQMAEIGLLQEIPSPPGTRGRPTVHLTIDTSIGGIE